MHELSLANAIVASASKHARGRRVRAVNLRVGRLRQVMPESLEFYFGFVTEGTVCEGARLVPEVVAAQLRCSECAHEWQPEWPLFLCPVCDGAHVTVVAGNEFEIESLEMEAVASASAQDMEAVASASAQDMGEASDASPSGQSA
jgi:hydrogenase nickel incorporation protein HypA/HybF